MNPIVNFSLHCYQICEINKNQLHGKRIVSGPVRFRLSIFCRGGCSSAVLFDDNHLWLILGWVRISAEMKTGLGLGQGWVFGDKTLHAGFKNSHFSSKENIFVGKKSLNSLFFVRGGHALHNVTNNVSVCVSISNMKQFD